MLPRDRLNLHLHRVTSHWPSTCFSVDPVGLSGLTSQTMVIGRREMRKKQGRGVYSRVEQQVPTRTAMSCHGGSGGRRNLVEGVWVREGLVSS